MHSGRSQKIGVGGIKMGERSDIANVIGALAVHVDARRWSELLAVFAPEVRVDYVSLFGGEAQSVKREELVGGWRKLLPGFTRTCHIIGTPAITLSGETAQASACVVAWHFVKTPELEGRDYWLVGGCYEMSFAKIGGTWRIAGLTLARAWAEGNLDLPRIAGERAANQ
jgi:SnoaL-like domain